MAKFESFATIGSGFTRLHLSVGKRFSVQIKSPKGVLFMDRVIHSITTQDLGKTDFAVIETAALALPTGSIRASTGVVGTTVDVVFVVRSGADFLGVPEQL